MRASVFRKVSFNSAHRLNNPAWDEATNQKVFGLCNNPNYHGHNYTLIVRVTGEINKETGFVIDLKTLKDMMNDSIVNKFDHQNLNLDVPQFKELNPTAENIAMVIWNILREKLSEKFDLTVTLYETERNYVEFTGGR